MLIKQVNDFKLVSCKDNESYYITKDLLDKSEVIIAKIGLPFGAVIPSILTIEDHLQDYVVDFEDYKNFIQLVDEVYFRFKTSSEDKKMA